MSSEDKELERIMEKKMRELLRRKSAVKSVKVVNRPLKVTDSNFKEMVEKNSNVIVDFWAVWCPPCRITEPIIEELAEKYRGKVVFGKLNVDENQETAMRFNVLAIPTLIFFKNGREVDRVVGAVPKEILELKIKKFIGS